MNIEPRTLLHLNNSGEDYWVYINVRDQAHNLWLMKEYTEHGSTVIQYWQLDIAPNTIACQENDGSGFDGTVSPEFIRRDDADGTQLIAVKLRGDNSIRDRINPIDFWW